MKKDSAIIYESIYKTIELIPDTELKWEAIKGILRYSFYGEELNSDNPLVKMVYTSAFPSIRNAVERYEMAVESGKRGGRPSTIDKEKVLQLKKQGKTYQEISDELDCPKNTIKKILQREGTKGTKGTNEVCTPPENIEGTKGTNLKGYYPIEKEETDGVQRVQTFLYMYLILYLLQIQIQNLYLYVLYHQRWGTKLQRLRLTTRLASLNNKQQHSQI